MKSRPRLSPVACILVVVAALTAGCGSDEASPSSSDGCAYPDSGAAAKQVDKPSTSPDLGDSLTATLALTTGNVRLTLTPERTPCTVASFASLAAQNYFDATECHRVTTAGIFVLQCGDPTATGKGGPGYTIPDEVDGSETYPAGTVAMANTGAPDSGGSQFFLVYEDSQLSPNYTVFGSIDDAGLTVLREIGARGVAGGGTDGQPAETVTISEVTLD